MQTPKLLLPLLSVAAISAASMDAQVVYENTFDDDPATILRLPGGTNDSNVFLGNWVSTNNEQRFIYNEIYAHSSGDYGQLGALTFLANNNGAQRGFFHVIDGSSIDAGSGTFSFDIILNTLPTNLIRVAVFEVNNGSGTFGNQNTYDTNSNPTGTDFIAEVINPDTNYGPLSGVYSEGDASSAIIGTQMSLTGDFVVGSYEYPFEYTGGDIVIGMSVLGSDTNLGEGFATDNWVITMGSAVVTWAGLTVEEGGFVTTDEFGVIWVGDDTTDIGDWVYVYDIMAYVWLPEANYTAGTGVWTYIPNP